METRSQKPRIKIKNSKSCRWSLRLVSAERNLGESCSQALHFPHQLPLSSEVMLVGISLGPLLDQMLPTLRARPPPFFFCLVQAFLALAALYRISVYIFTVLPVASENLFLARDKGALDKVALDKVRQTQASLCHSPHPWGEDPRLESRDHLPL